MRVEVRWQASSVEEKLQVSKLTEFNPQSTF